MKINSINVSAFGKLENFNMSFCDGLNLIYGENENGKTTVMEFIKMMFYGSIQTSRISLDKNVRKKYLPWSGKNMAGSIDFENNGVRYRLLREFRGSNSTDKITLMNLDLGTSENLTGKSDVGYTVFGIGGAAFEKSVFIDNSVIMGNSPDADGEINARLANIADTGDEDVSLEKVIKRINAAKENLISKNGKKGRLAESREALKLLGNDLIGAQSTDAERERMQLALDSKTVAVADILRERHELFEKLKSSERSEMKQKLLEFVKQAELYEQCESALTLSDGSLADAAFCDEIKSALNDITAAEITVTQQKSAVDTLAGEIAVLQSGQACPSNITDLKLKKNRLGEEIAAKETALHSLSATVPAKKQKFNPFLFVLGIILVVAGVTAGATVKPIFLAASVVGAIPLILTFILRPKDKKALGELDFAKSELENEIVGLKTELEDLDLQINEITVKLSTNESIVAAKREEALKRQTELLTAQNTLLSLTTNLLSLAGKYKPLGDVESVRNALKDIENNLVLLEKYRIAAEYAARGTRCATLSEAKAKLASLTDVDLSVGDHTKYQEQLRMLDEKKNALSTEIAELKTELRTKFSGLKTIPEIENEMASLKLEIEEMNNYYEALLIAEDTLNAAFSGLRRNFGGAIDSRSLEIFSRLTDNKYGGVTVSKNFDISVNERENFGMHSIEYLSRGASHQAYFALRLALCELLGRDNGGLPILLDDVFSQYDDSRALTAFRFLSDYAKENQIIFFTCHQSTRDTAANNGANIINM